MNSLEPYTGKNASLGSIKFTFISKTDAKFCPQLFNQTKNYLKRTINGHILDAFFSNLFSKLDCVILSTFPDRKARKFLENRATTDFKDFYFSINVPIL